MSQFLCETSFGVRNSDIKGTVLEDLKIDFHVKYEQQKILTICTLWHILLLLNIELLSTLLVLLDDLITYSFAKMVA